jgi:hypothetical protein
MFSRIGERPPRLLKIGSESILLLAQILNENLLSDKKVTL